MGWHGPLTYRQYRAWLAWLDRADAEPDKHCLYLMQVALVVARIPYQVAFGLTGEMPSILDFRLPISEEQRQAADRDREEGRRGKSRPSIYCPDVTADKVERWQAKLERMKFERGPGPRPDGKSKLPSGDGGEN